MDGSVVSGSLQDVALTEPALVSLDEAIALALDVTYAGCGVVDAALRGFLKFLDAHFFFLIDFVVSITLKSNNTAFSANLQSSFCNLLVDF